MLGPALIGSILANQVRHYIGTKSRDLRMERALADELDQSSRALKESLIAAAYAHRANKQSVVSRRCSWLMPWRIFQKITVR